MALASGLPASAVPLPAADRLQPWKNSDQLQLARAVLFPLPTERPSPDTGFRQDCRGLSMDSGGQGSELDPRTAAWSLSPPHSSRHQEARRRPPAPPLPTLLWTICALPGPPQGSQSKNHLAFFVPISESPSAPQRGPEPIMALPAPHLPAVGDEVERLFPSSHY